MDNINDIISSLSADDINMLKDVASSILGENQQPQAQNDSNGTVNSLLSNGVNNSQNQSINALANLGINANDFNMMMKAKSLFDKMNSATNKNTDLIMALKPHLSPEHQAKADTAIKILRLFEILPLLKDLF